jgi:hypothetical protein
VCQSGEPHGKLEARRGEQAVAPAHPCIVVEARGASGAAARGASVAAAGGTLGTQGSAAAPSDASSDSLDSSTNLVADTSIYVESLSISASAVTNSVETEH